MKKTKLLVATALATCALGLCAATSWAKTAEVTITSKSPAAVAAFKEARDLLDNVRVTEGAAGMRKAVELDGDFALAHAYLGSVTPGAEGLKELEKASQLGSKLPEPEKLEIQALLTGTRGEELKSRDAWEKVAKLAPGDWHVQFTLGGVYTGERKWDLAAAALKRATDLNPRAGAAYNSLGYVYLTQEKNEEAIAAFKKYSEVLPKEPNPYDSLAEAQMAASHLADAEASFQKAFDVSPEFYIALQGVAQTRFLRNDWTGGKEALDQAQAAATRPVDKLGLEFNRAWSLAAAGQVDQAMKTFDALDAAAKSAHEEGTYAFVPIARAKMLVDAGQYDVAIAAATQGLERGAKPGLPGGVVNGVRRAGLANRMLAEARSGQLDAAAATLAKLEAEAKATPTNAGLASNVQLGRGEIALARGDAKTAAAALAGCVAQDTYAQWRLVEAREKAGDKAGAQQLRNKVLRTNRRDGEYLYVRAQMADGQPVSQQE
jgi:tetratricopeptide (TPR) repeat protein